MITAEIIAIGDEILFAHTINTNAVWLSKQLSEVGVLVKKHLVISDNTEAIISSIDQSIKNADITFLTGGLGPTNDDLTKQCLAEYFGSELICDEQALAHIEILFKKWGKTLTDVNIQQAFLPKECDPIPNTLGTAYGMWFEKQNHILVSMPGVPFEMEEMAKRYVIPKVLLRYGKQKIQHKVIKTIGIGESALAEQIKKWEDSLPPTIKLAYLPSLGEVKLRLTAMGDAEEVMKEVLDSAVVMLLPLIAPYIYGYDDTTIIEAVTHMLKKQRKMIAIAESCTGGALSKALTSISGSSEWFLGSVVVYANRVKEKLLKVSPRLIDDFGAVSEEVAKDMAQNVRREIGADIAIATTGVVGPTGGTLDKPVGTVWIAVADDNTTVTHRFEFSKNRTLNIDLAVTNALNMLRCRLENISS